MTNVVVIGHADADGHVIAEQARRNLSTLANFDVSVVVDPQRTQGHRSWLHLDRLQEIEAAELVIFVDLMFGPMTYAEESDALVAFVTARPNKAFLLVDHHPLPERRLASARNLRCTYRPDVIECTFGPRSGLMVVAALCENQREGIAAVVRPHHDLIALGMRRAAAHGSALPGRLLMNLLAARRWDKIVAIAEDDAANHRLVRGRRPADYTPSAIMLDAQAEAERLVQPPLKANAETIHGPDLTRTPMPFDIDGERYVREDESKPYTNAPVQTRDLESLSTLLEVAALSLTESPGTAFSWDVLIEEARRIAGSGVEIADRDLKIVYDKATFLEGSMKSALRLK